MSYEIEHGKRVLSLKTDDQRFDRDEWLLYCAASSSNNVSPRTYDWSVIACDTYRVWGGNIMLPTRIWEWGGAADGGSIKPWDKQTNGLAYVKSWKNAVKNKRPIDGWQPTISLHVEEAQLAKIAEGGIKLFAAYENDSEAKTRYETFTRLYPRPLNTHSNWKQIVTHAQLLDAVYLYMERRRLPFSVYLTDGEHSRFLKEKPAELVPA